MSINNDYCDIKYMRREIVIFQIRTKTIKPILHRTST